MVALTTDQKCTRELESTTGQPLWFAQFTMEEHMPI